MAGLEFLSFQGLWLVLAGFILGFAASTLWEWLYYRGKRQAQVGQGAATAGHTPQADNPPLDHVEAAGEEGAPTWAFTYRSPGVYLESEQSAAADQAEGAENPQAKVIIAPPPDPIVSTPARVEPTQPRLNPATLAALQTVVAETPVAQSASPPTPVALMTDEPKRRNPLVAPAPFPPDVENRNGAERPAPSVNGVEFHPPRTTFVATSTPAAVATTTLQSIPQPSATPVVTDNATPDHPDNLAMIRGVGEAYKRRLYGVGIYTWRQVAESEPETLRRITRAKPNADINAWRTQARELAEKFQRWHTTFRGPLDDFTHIDGIGAITAALLYKAGICTYDQLAGALPDELAQIVPAPTVGEENDFTGWIAAAGRLANVKRRNEGLLA